jgi:hypothetical protein
MAMNATIATKQPAPAGPRPALASVVRRGVSDAPYRVLIHGVPGVGKTTFAAAAPSAVFLGTEDGFGTLEADRLPQPESWTDVLGYVRQLATEDHQWQTLVVDSIDWLEPIIWSHVCRIAGVESIKDVDGGYGSGYTAALDQWRLFVAELENVRRTKRMHVVLIAHSLVKSFKNPEGPDFDRWQMKLNEKAAGFLGEWCDVVAFANFETFVKTEGKKATKGKGFGGERAMFLTRQPAYDAKNRYNLPERLALNWDEFAGAMKTGAAYAASLRKEIETKRAGLTDAKLAAAVGEALAKFGTNVAKLVEMNARLDARIAASAPASATTDTTTDTKEEKP